MVTHLLIVDLLGHYQLPPFYDYIFLEFTDFNESPGGR